MSKQTPDNAAAAVHRVAQMFALFSVMLLTGMSLSSWLFLPHLTTVSVDDNTYDITTIPSLHASITTDITSAEQQRNDFVLPVQDNDYVSLRDKRQQNIDIRRAALALLHVVAQQNNGKKPAPVVVQSITYDAYSLSVRIVGDVRAVGDQSMTVLATLVEAFRTVPLIELQSLPQFSTKKDPFIGPYSPFDLTFTVHGS